MLAPSSGNTLTPPPASPVTNSLRQATSITINDTALPNGALNLPLEFQFTATNGLQPFTWTETGALPAGVAFSPQGDLSGTPTELGSFSIIVSLQDSNGQSAAP